VKENIQERESNYTQEVYAQAFGDHRSVVDVRLGLVSFVKFSMAKKISVVYQFNSQIHRTSLADIMLDILVISESPAQTLGNLIGAIGGNLNLYFGPDFMTVLAYLELITVGMCSVYARRRR